MPTGGLFTDLLIDSKIHFDYIIKYLLGSVQLQTDLQNFKTKKRLLFHIWPHKTVKCHVVYWDFMRTTSKNTTSLTNDRKITGFI